MKKINNKNSPPTSQQEGARNFNLQRDRRREK
nr:MAG TPA: hypothetical protein [Caudoviricetes sp.]